MRMTRRNTAGYTLVEISIALLVIAVGFTSLLAVFPVGARWARESYNRAHGPGAAYDFLRDQLRDDDPANPILIRDIAYVNSTPFANVADNEPFFFAYDAAARTYKWRRPAPLPRTILDTVDALADINPITGTGPGVGTNGVPLIKPYAGFHMVLLASEDTSAAQVVNTAVNPNVIFTLYDVQVVCFARRPDPDTPLNRSEVIGVFRTKVFFREQ